MNKYKKIGIKNINLGKYATARNFLSLAYEQEPSEEILFLISICRLAMIDELEARILFDYYNERIQRGLDMNDLQNILNSLESKNMIVDEIDEQDAIRYEDFKRIVAKEGDFKRVFQSIMFSTKVIISNKDDFLEFISNLVNAGFIEMSMAYIESAAAMFGGDERIEVLSREIFRLANNENIY